MSIVVLNNPQAWVQGSSYLGYDNAFLRSGGVVSASAADAGFPETNATSWLITGGGWKATANPEINLSLTLPAAENLNSYALFKHNLGTLGGVTVKLQHSDDGLTWTDFIGSAKVPGDDKAIFFIGTGITKLFWRLNFTGLVVGDTLIIGQAFVGNALRMFSPPETGFTPPELALNNQYISSRADGGDYLGRSLIRRGSQMQFNNSIVHKDWIRDNWQVVMRAIEKTPFYYAWDNVNFPVEVAYCYVEKKIATPKYVNSAYFSLSLKFIALIE